MERGCVIFRCVRRQGHFCCADCRERDVCKSPCQNDPAACGAAREKAPGAKEVKEYAESAGRSSRHRKGRKS